MRYRIQVRQWIGLVLGYHLTYSGACKAACELSIRVPGIAVSVDRCDEHDIWYEECQWINGE